MRNSFMVFATFVLSVIATVGVQDTSASALDALRARQGVIADAQIQLDAAPNNQERQDALSTAVRETFDFDRLARESIDENWDAMTEAQKVEYMRLFKKLVEKSTLSVLKTYRAAQTEYIDVQEDGSEAVLTTVVISTDDDELAIQYKMHNVDGRWWIWDRTIGLDTEITEYDVSTAENYYSAFNKIISENGVEELLKRLRSKADGDGKL
jgi:phospholipid transport system substrate-binding protein